MTTRDPCWNMVSTLMALDDNPRTCKKGKTVIENGDITRDTSNTLFGLASTYFGGDSSYPTGTAGSMVRIASHFDFSFGSGDFTVECWAWPLSASVLAMPDDDHGDRPFVPYPLVERSNATFATGSWSFHFAAYRNEAPPNPDFASWAMQFWASDYSTTAPMLEYEWPITGGVPQEPPITWAHYAVTRNENEWTLWINGVPADSITSSIAIGEPSPGADLRVGNSIFSTDNKGVDQPTTGRAFEGNIGQVRITKGWARYTRTFEEAFTTAPYQTTAAATEPPTAPFPTAEDAGDYGQDLGPAGAAATGARVDGVAGADAPPPPPPRLPSPPPHYDPRDQAEMRRILERTFQRGT